MEYITYKILKPGEILNIRDRQVISLIHYENTNQCKNYALESLCHSASNPLTDQELDLLGDCDGSSPIKLIFKNV